MSLHLTNIKTFIIEWHILLILLLTFLIVISLFTFIIIKLKQKKLSYVFLFLFFIFSIIIIIYWATTEEMRFLWLGYLIVYGRDYLILFYECAWFFLKGMFLAYFNCLKLLITCTPYESYIFAGEYWLAFNMFVQDLYFIGTTGSQVFFKNLAIILSEGPQYRMITTVTDSYKYGFYFNLFLNLWHCDNFIYI